MADVAEDAFGLPPLSDNAGPLADPPTIEEIITYLEREYASNKARAEEIMEKGAKFYHIGTDAEDEAATEFMNSVRACWKNAEAARVKHKDVYDQRAGAIHAWFRTNILDPIGQAPGPTDKRDFDPTERDDLGVGPRIMMASTLFKRAKLAEEKRKRDEEARILREAEDKRRAESARLEREAREAELAASRKRTAESIAKAEAEAVEKRRQAEEARAAENAASEARAAAERAAAAPAADMTRARGDRGGVSSLVEKLEFRDLDKNTVDLEKLRPFIKDAHIEMAVRAYADANRATVSAAIKEGISPIRGVFFFINRVARGRT